MAHTLPEFSEAARKNGFGRRRQRGNENRTRRTKGKTKHFLIRRAEFNHRDTKSTEKNRREGEELITDSHGFNLMGKARKILSAAI
jgi:hypothetical protein